MLINKGSIAKKPKSLSAFGHIEEDQRAKNYSIKELDKNSASTPKKYDGYDQSSV